MTEPFGPPFRADHVGSLLRPERLKQARDEFLGAQTVDDNLGPHNNDDLRTVEDSCVHEVIELQRRAGLCSATDGEFRRSWWHLDFLWGLDGVARHVMETGIAFSAVATRAPNTDWNPSRKDVSMN